MHVTRLFTRRRPKGVTVNAPDAPSQMSFPAALKKVFVFPTSRFSLKANPVFTLGAVFYHIGIITISTSYGVSVALLGYHLLRGDGIPDVSTGEMMSSNHSLSNLFAIVFGNGEPLQAAFLFGPFAKAFMTVTWATVASALLGNTLLLLTHLRGRGGAIVRDLDPAAKGLRVKGIFKTSHLAVTGLVYAVIWTEILARLEVVHGIVYLHAFLGATMPLVFPYTYLFQMIYSPVGVFYAARRWQQRYIA